MMNARARRWVVVLALVAMMSTAVIASAFGTFGG